MESVAALDIHVPRSRKRLNVRKDVLEARPCPLRRADKWTAHAVRDARQRDELAARLVIVADFVNRQLDGIPNQATDG